MKSFSIANINVPNTNKQIVLEKIKKNIILQKRFVHIVSLNPENMVIAQNNIIFKDICNTSELALTDGIGVKWAVQFLYSHTIERIQGVDFMKELLELAHTKSLRVLFIGGRAKIADNLAKCYSRSYPASRFKGIQGVKNISKPTQNEEQAIIHIVRTMTPHFIFVAFGSPAQEIWINNHKSLFKGSVCMGIGGGFDFLTGNVKRAPHWIRQIGFEWLYRLFVQPWRIKRQLRLIQFVWLVVKQKYRL